ncbi:MAG: methionine--tRNA ligase [Chloroflexi bacterium]|nr:methionine--tRNA ligase [Chloroflexota bacterium]
MTKKILVSVAWPYANGPLHLGHIAGAYLTADIFARYHRLIGNDVLMVSGSDSHGTPVTVTADEEGITARQVFERSHALFLEAWQKLGISFDLFTHTDTENHWAISQDFFARLLDKGSIYKATEKQLYCENDARFLPDRYISGTCPHCQFPRARGDQCDNCSRVLDAMELIDPKCKFAKWGTPPHKIAVRESEHFYLDLGKFEKRLFDYLADKDGYWKPNVVAFVRNWLKSGLHGRAITRDLDWGITLPLTGYDSKRIYVWFEAVIGYYSASVEWAKNRGTPDKWKEWWTKADDVRGYYFVGKDNIPFHTIIWPAMLLGYDENLPLPYDVPANEFLNLEGRKFSKSEHWAVWINDYLKTYDPDPLRYLLSANMPEFADTDFTWKEFVRRNNDELIATWGNLANRVLTFTYKNFEQRVPTPSELTDADRALIAKSEAAFTTVGDALERVRFKEAIGIAMDLAREANQYLQIVEPWKTIKVERARAATSLYVALRVIDNLKTLLYPFLPFSSHELHQQLGYEGDLLGAVKIKTFHELSRDHTAAVYEPGIHTQEWKPSQLLPGQRLREPKALFKKFDEKIAEEEKAKLGKPG